MKSFKFLAANFLAAFTAASILTLGPSWASAQDRESLPAHVADFARVEAANDHVVGSETAAITLIVWASVTCPHCAQWFSEEWPIVKTELVETEKLRVVFRPFPTPPHELSQIGFRLAECAPTEDYMSIIQYQMQNQKAIFNAAKEGRAPEVFTEIAKLAGMETNDAITTCLKNPDISAHITDSINRAKLAEVKGVPAFLINGETYKGPQDAKSLIALINDMDEKGLSVVPDGRKPSKPNTEQTQE